MSAIHNKAKPSGPERRLCEDSRLVRKDLRGHNIFHSCQGRFKRQYPFPALDLDSVYAVRRIANSAASDWGSDYTEATAKGRRCGVRSGASGCGCSHQAPGTERGWASGRGGGGGRRERGRDRPAWHAARRSRMWPWGVICLSVTPCPHERAENKQGVMTEPCVLRIPIRSSFCCRFIPHPRIFFQ